MVVMIIFLIVIKIGMNYLLGDEIWTPVERLVNMGYGDEPWAKGCIETEIESIRREKASMVQEWLEGVVK